VKGTLLSFGSLIANRGSRATFSAGVSKSRLCATPHCPSPRPSFCNFTSQACVDHFF
jgi:hypothetical protein